MTVLTNAESSAVELLRSLATEAGGAHEVPLVKYVRRMESQGRTADEAIATLEELIDERVVRLTSRYSVRFA